MSFNCFCSGLVSFGQVFVTLTMAFWVFGVDWILGYICLAGFRVVNVDLLSLMSTDESYRFIFPLE